MALLEKLFIFFTLFILLFPNTQVQSMSNEFKITRRLLLDTEFEDLPIVAKKKPNSISTNNQTKSIKPFSNSIKNQTGFVKSAPKLPKNKTKLAESASNLPKNQTKLIKFKSDPAKNQTNLIKLKSDSLKNQTKLIKLKSVLAKNQTKLIKFASDPAISTVKNKTKLVKTQLKKLNSTKPTSNLIKKLSDPTESSSLKNKTNKTEPKSKNPEKSQPTDRKPKSPIKPKTTNGVDQEAEEDDLVSEFRDLPTRFQQTLLPDLEKISTTSKVYLSRYNKQITKGFKPYVGTKYAPTIASIVLFAFIIIPLILVSLLFNRIKAYFSLQKLIIFIQVYLSIYFSILCSSSLVTGLEPLRFFYATSQSTYIWLQILQTLGYVLYLLLLLMYLVLVFSTETGPGTKALGLAQTFVGFAVGLHYYVTVFHRVVLRQPPKTNWKVHGIYATCFLVICLFANADRRKKAYLEDGGEEGKKN